MTRDEAFALMLEVLGFRTGLQSTLIRHIKLAQTTLELGPTYPWFLLSEDSFTTTLSGEERILVPTDFLGEKDDLVLKYVPDDAESDLDEVDLKKGFYDTLRQNYRDVERALGPPEAYAIVGNYFRLFPTPDDDYTIRMIFYQAATPLDTNVENVWLKYAPKVLMGMAGQTVAASLRDVVAQGEFARWEKEGRLLLHQRTVDRELENSELQIGGPH